ncbi:MAG: translation elongation factor Ts [Candidatus Doudnabacteria bacterium]|nr:translation elongation factor Ts [Candidatus Doudnabacteria bacterium]
MNDVLKELRETTGAGLMDIKEALTEAGGDKEKAIEILRKKGSLKLGKKSDRVAKEGIIESYIHGGGRIGVLLEINCETDFVARTEDFKNLAKELALHIAAANPLYVNVSDVPAEVIEKEKEIYKEQAKASGKPEEVINKMLDGKIQKYYEETCLLEQPYVKNPDIKVKEFVSNEVAKMGENVVIRRFARFILGA